MMASRPVQAVARPVTAQEFAAARPIIVGQQPLRPTAATAGVTPAVARQLYLPLGPVVRPAPGPVVRAQAPGPAGTAFARPALAPPAGSGPGNTAIRPAAGGPATPEQNRLPLTAPGGRPATSPAPNTPEPNRPAGCGAWCSPGRAAADGTAGGAPWRTCSRARRTSCRNAPAATAYARGGAAGASSGSPAAASRAPGRRPARSPTAARGATCRTPSTQTGAPTTRRTASTP